MTSNPQSIDARRDSAESARGASGDPGKFIPPAWLINMLKAIVLFICSAVVGAVSAAWQVRGYCDQLEAHMRVHDSQIENVTKTVDRGFADVHEDLRDLRKDRSH